MAWVPFRLVFSNSIGEWHMSHDACPWQILEKTQAECAFWGTVQRHRQDTTPNLVVPMLFRRGSRQM